MSGIEPRATPRTVGGQDPLRASFLMTVDGDPAKDSHFCFHTFKENSHELPFFQSTG